ncbi:MAG: Xaa-Pro dipeptidase, partial [Imperialibacter sp.]
MKRLSVCFLLLISAFSLKAQSLKALVGGTLIDGFGGTPIQNSVIIIEGEKIKAVGTVGSLEIPPDA